MLYIVKINGHQYIVKKDELISTEKINGKKGDIVEFKDILLTQDNEKINIGQPILKGVLIKAEIIEQYKGPKIEIVKFKRKNRSLKRSGHRQPFTKIKIL
jgi:large subunit ribosomal protein L21